MRSSLFRILIFAWPLVFSIAAMAEESPAAEPVLLDFYASWCQPCQQMTPAIEAMAAEGCDVRRIDVSAEPELAKRYSVTSVPCFVVVQSGIEVDRVVGVASIERLKFKMKAKSRTAAKPVAPAPAASPHPAWRYEPATGSRAAVVRIYCRERETVRSIGSGALVQWNGRVVVLTARHVVADAKSDIIVELATKRTHWGKIVRVDPTWDCAVLELVGNPQGVLVADVERGDASIQQEGNRLESCGYGPDGKLACNSGLFLGYRRSSSRPQGPDDWFVISGHARPGDSGGPVFNERGRLVGVLWGTDGRTVVCVQAGRLHQLLDAAVPEPKPLNVLIASLQRVPTPPKPCDPSTGCCPATSPTVADATSTYGDRQHLKWREGAQKKDAETDARIAALIALQEHQARAAAATPPKSEAPTAQAANAKEDQSASPAIAVACLVFAIGIAAAIYYLTAQESG